MTFPWKKAITLDNGVLEMVISPELNRPLKLNLKGKENLFWNKGFSLSKKELLAQDEFGGFYTWMAPQDGWKEKWGAWPPNTKLVKSPCRVKWEGKLKVSLISPVSQKYALQFIKTFEMDPNEARVTATITFKNKGKSPLRWAVWNIAGVKHEGLVRIPGGRKEDINFWASETGEKFYSKAFEQRGQDIIMRFGKFQGESGKCWLPPGPTQLIYEAFGQVWTRTWTHPEKASLYTDNNSQIEIWASTKEGSYCELEVLGPEQMIPPRGKIVFTEVWDVEKK